MNSSFLILTFRFLALFLAQVLVFDHINLFGFINPCIYLIYIYLYPAPSQRLTFLFTSFLLGLLVDMVSGTGGVHAAASVFVAYARPLVLKFSFGVLYDNHHIKFSSVNLNTLFIYISLLTFFHHIILYALDVFNIQLIFIILKQIFFAGFFSILLNFLIIMLLKRKKA